MLRGKGEERCTWYMAGNLPGLDRREDAAVAVGVMELLQDGNRRAKGNKTYHLVISFHPTDRRLTPAELEDVVARTVRAAGLEEHQYIAVRHSEQEHEHLHVAVNKIHPETLKIHHPYKAIHAYQALARILEEELGLHRVERTRRTEEVAGCDIDCLCNLRYHYNISPECERAVVESARCFSALTCEQYDAWWDNPDNHPCTAAERQLDIACSFVQP
jgi:hypothetical protein